MNHLLFTPWSKQDIKITRRNDESQYLKPDEINSNTQKKSNFKLPRISINSITITPKNESIVHEQSKFLISSLDINFMKSN